MIADIQYAIRMLAKSLGFSSVGATDPAIFLWIPVLLGAVSFFARYLPARGAARLDPIKAIGRT